jgi:prolyl-tRNA synthetase
MASNFDGQSIIGLTIPSADVQDAWFGKSLPLGYLGPDIEDDYIAARKQVHPHFVRLVDQTAIDLKNFVTGANQSGYHVVGANWGTEFKLPDLVVDIRKARPGDRALHDPEQLLKSTRGIEAGHIFQLGTKYSENMGATFTNEQGEEKPLVMGCYGVGVSRLAQSAVEQSHDQDGIIWPVAIAPYQAIVTIPNIKDAQQVAVGEKLYSDLTKAGIETLLDDRDERAGVKFKDADLIGIPYRIVTGRSIAHGKVEVVHRATRNAQEVAIDDLINTIQSWIKQELEMTDSQSKPKIESETAKIIP